MTTNWKNIIAGDSYEYEKAYLFFYDRFYNYGMKFTVDSGIVEDAIQEVLVKMWTERSKLADVTNPNAYLFTWFRNELFRKIKSALSHSPLNIPSAEPEFAHDVILVQRESDHQLQQRLQQTIDTLSPRQKEAIFLRFYEGLSYEEVAATLGITTKATYKLVARALIELRNKMGISLLLILSFFRNIHSTAIHF